MTWVITIASGLIVGVFVFEYGVFRKKRERKKLALVSSQQSTVSALWIDTVNAAVQKLCENEKVKLNSIPSLRVEDSIASVRVEAWANGSISVYKLKVDKTGDILEIQRTR